MDTDYYGDECYKCPDGMGIIEFRKDGTPTTPCNKCGYMPKVNACLICGDIYDVERGRTCGHDEDDDLDDMHFEARGWE